MFSEKDLIAMQSKGINTSSVDAQIENYKTGFPFMQLIAPATPGHGILKLDDDRVQQLATSYPEAVRGREIIKFVPASGAASRMFKILFEFREDLLNRADEQKLFMDEGFNSASYFFDNIRKFAFYDDLEQKMLADGRSLSGDLNSREYLSILNYLLGEAGLNYANLPKGLLKFHAYHNEPARTAMEEHLVEAAHYTCDSNDVASVHFTVSPEHQEGFESLVEAVSERYERRFGIRYNIGFSVQKTSTDIIAVDMENLPFRESDGSILFRPGGHGALIENLNDLKADIVFIKNIDNVVPDRLKATTYLYKEVIGALLIELQEEVFRMLISLGRNDIREERLIDMAIYCNEKLSIRLPENFRLLDRNDKIDLLKRKLNRPMRVCGMVKNEGEPGGGPFWVSNKEGNISLQIVETSQIELANKEQKEILSKSTHFNPVDLVCGLKTFRGEAFNLPDFVDPLTGFISEKSKDGKQLKAQELPGLWNGAMADWITLFVEVPVITFNPVKVINDLLRKEHLAI
jgi:hypothetical protein